MGDVTNLTTAIPSLGVGLGYRTELKEAILAHRASIDYLEIITDNYIAMPQAERVLDDICALFPVIPHGVNLSIGSVMPLDRAYLQAIKRISDRIGSPYYSEHLCMTRMPGRDIGHLAPLWFTEELLQHVIERVRTVQDILEKPLILENVTYMVQIPHAPLSQEEFFQRLVEATGCGILLDVTNVFINATNHQFDPIAFLDHMPLDHLVQVHLAGGYWRHGWLVDGHSELVPPAIFALFQALASRCHIKGVIFEHDAYFPEMAEMLRQIEYARTIINPGKTGEKGATFT